MSPAATAKVSRSPSGLWFWVPERRPRAELRLICFHHAGGSARTFGPWLPFLPSRVELVALELPGRGARFLEPSLPTVQAVLDELEAPIRPLLDRPYVFVGHSMGAFLSFFYAQRLLARGARLPESLVVSAAVAPQHFDVEHSLARSRLSDPELTSELRRLGGTPAEVLEHPELLSFVLPVLRADFGVCASIRADGARPLPLPVLAVTGQQDPFVDRSLVQGWQDYAGSKFSSATFPGDHFFIHQEPQQVVAHIFAALGGGTAWRWPAHDPGQQHWRVHQHGPALLAGRWWTARVSRAAPTVARGAAPLAGASAGGPAAPVRWRERSVAPALAGRGSAPPRWHRCQPRSALRHPSRLG